MNRNILVFISFIFSIIIHASIIFSFENFSNNFEKKYNIKTKAHVIDVQIIQNEISKKIKNKNIEVSNTQKNSIMANANVKISRAKMLGELSLEYPKLARLLKQEGLVILGIKINKLGEVSDIKIIKSSGFEVLDIHAKNKVYQAKFIPKKILSDNKIKLMEDFVTLEIDFKLERI